MLYGKYEQTSLSDEIIVEQIINLTIKKTISRNLFFASKLYFEIKNKTKTTLITQAMFNIQKFVPYSQKNAPSSFPVDNPPPITAPKNIKTFEIIFFKFVNLVFPFPFLLV